MDLLEFTQKIVESVAWPATAIIAVGVLRTPLTELLGRIKKVKVGDFEADVEAQDFKRTLKANSRKLQTIAVPMLESQEKSRFDHILKISPKSVIVESWKKLERAISQLLIDLKVQLEEEDFRRPIKMLDKFFQLGSSKVDSDVLRSMYLLRNKVVHYEPLVVTREDAKIYFENTQKILTSLKEIDNSLYW